MEGRKLLKRPKLLRRAQTPVEPEDNSSQLRRRPWWELPDYKSFPLVVDKREDDGGITKTTYWVKCPKHERLTLLEICIKGIFYFDPKDRACKKCWKLPPKKNYPPPFQNVIKETRVPEAMQILNFRKTQRMKIIEKEGEELIKTEIEKSSEKSVIETKPEKKLLRKTTVPTPSEDEWVKI